MYRTLNYMPGILVGAENITVNNNKKIQKLTALMKRETTNVINELFI